jgi:hypothetical protein
MYRTSQGERILLGGERRLFEESLSMMADELSDHDGEFGVPAFDQLQRGQKLFALYRAGRALLRPDEPPPEKTAFLDAAVAAVYQHVLDMVIQEIDQPDLARHPESWRQHVVRAARESQATDPVPNETSRDKAEWELVVDCLVDNVLWDRDFELQVHLDADPDKSRDVKKKMGITEGYYSAVAHDPPDHQLNLYFDALYGLTPRGRGRSFEQEGNSKPPGDALF